MLSHSFRALVFDLDGTLVDSTDDIAAAVNRMRSRYGLNPLPVSAIRMHLGDGASVLVARCLPERPEHRTEALEHFRADYREHCLEKTEPYADVRELVPVLARSFRLAVLTNKDRSMSMKILKGLGLLDSMQVVMGGDGPCLKPCAEGLLSILDEMEVTPSDALMIGDHQTDLEAAHRAGVAAAFCEYGYGNDGGLRADFRLGRFADIISIVSPAGP